MSNASMTYEEINNCPLCTSSLSKSLDVCRDTLIQEINRALPNDVEKLPTLSNHRRKCDGCNLVYLSPRLDKYSLSKLYSLWYRYGYQNIFENNDHIQQRLNVFRKFHLNDLMKYHPKPGVLLDIGCGTGLFLKVAKEAAWQTVGIEFDEETAIKGSKANDVEIRVGTLFETLKHDEKFDAITLFDYLEHTMTPGKDLDFIIQALKPGGTLIIRVPNIKGWQSKVMGKSWLAVISNHLTYFSPDVLKQTLSSKGLVVKSITARNYQSEFDIIKQRWTWLLARLKRSSTIEQGSVSESGTTSSETSMTILQAIKKMLHSIAIEQIDHIGGWFGFGNNLMIIAEKKQ